MAKPYEERLQEPVTEADAAGHRNLLKTHIIPLEKALTRLLRDKGTPGDVFDAQELALLDEVRRLLAKKSVPMSSLSIKRDAPIILLGRKPNPNVVKNRLLK